MGAKRLKYPTEVTNYKTKFLFISLRYLIRRLFFKLMAKTREQKKQIIKELEQELKKASSVMFVDYYGLDVGSVEDFRKMAKDRDCRYLVAKKNSFRNSS